MSKANGSNDKNSEAESEFSSWRAKRPSGESPYTTAFHPVVNADAAPPVETPTPLRASTGNQDVRKTTPSEQHLPPEGAPAAPATRSTQRNLTGGFRTNSVGRIEPIAPRQVNKQDASPPAHSAVPNQAPVPDVQPPYQPQTNVPYEQPLGSAPQVSFPLSENGVYSQPTHASSLGTAPGQQGLDPQGLDPQGLDPQWEWNSSVPDQQQNPSETGIYPGQFRNDRFAVPGVSDQQQPTEMLQQSYLSDSTTVLSRDQIQAAQLQNGVPTEGSVPNEPSGYQQKPRKQKPKELPMPVLLSIVAAILIVGGIAAFYLYNNNGESVASEDQAADAESSQSSETTVNDEPGTVGVEEEAETNVLLAVAENGAVVTGPVQAGSGYYKISVENAPEDATYQLKINDEAQGEPSAEITNFGFEGKGRQKVEVVLDSEEGSETFVINQFSYEGLVAEEYVIQSATFPREFGKFEEAIQKYDALVSEGHENAAISESDFYKGLEPNEYVVYIGGFVEEADAKEYCESKSLSSAQCLITKMEAEGAEPAEEAAPESESESV